MGGDWKVDETGRLESLALPVPRAARRQAEPRERASVGIGQPWNQIG